MAELRSRNYLTVGLPLSYLTADLEPQAQLAAGLRLTGRATIDLKLKSRNRVTLELGPTTVHIVVRLVELVAGKLISVHSVGSLALRTGKGRENDRP
jgi:hypothetical protein